MLSKSVEELPVAFHRQKNGMAEAIPFLSNLLGLSLEVELHGKFDNAIALFFGRYAEVGIGLSELLRDRVLNEVQVQVAAVERVQRMVQPVIHFNPELKFLRFRDVEVFEQSHVPVEEGWSVGHRKQRWAIRSNGSWS